MNCKTAILDEPFGQPSLLASVTPTIIGQLLERIRDLEATIDALVARLTVLEGLSAPPVGADTEEAHTPQQVTAPPNTAILEEIIQLRRDLEEHNEARALEIAQDRRRIAALEDMGPRPKVETPTAKTLDHLDTLDSVMKESRIRQTSFTNAARLLGLSSSRLRQLKPLFLEDRRFTIVKDPHHSQRLLIKTNFRM